MASETLVKAPRRRVRRIERRGPFWEERSAVTVRKVEFVALWCEDLGAIDTAVGWGWGC